MGFFDKILEKIGIKKKDEKEMGGEAKSDTMGSPVAPKKASGITSGGMASKVSKNDALAGEGKAAAAAISEVDVVAKLEGLAKGKELNWKVSIVDLLKLLDLDSSKEARIELAKELGCPEDLIGGDYSKMNVWLHKTVLKKIAENGGNIPADLLN